MDIKKDRVCGYIYEKDKEHRAIFTWKNSAGEVMLTDTIEGVFPGKYLFRLKDSMGLPLDFGVVKILHMGYAIDWVSYIEEARKQLRWDYQTYNDLVHLRNELTEYREYLDEVIKRFKVYVMKNIHPQMAS